MATYVYKCKECAALYEAVQAMTDPAYQECPGCQGPIHRVPQPFGVSYACGGFHCTDYPSRSRWGAGRPPSAGG